MLYQHEDTKIAVRLLANDVHIQEHVVTASPTGIHNEQRWTCLAPITPGQTLALEYRIIGLKKSCMVDVKVDGTWRFRTTHGPDETIRQLVDDAVMKEQHVLYYAKMCAQDQSKPDPYGSDDGEDDDFTPVKGSPAFEVGNIELLFYIAQSETGNTRYAYRKGPYFENDPERGLTQRAASDSKLTSKVYQEAGPATCSINLLKGRTLSEIEEVSAKFEAKRPLLSPVPFVSFKFLYRDQRVLNYECDQPSQDITSAGVSSGFWASVPVVATARNPAPTASQQQPQFSQQPQISQQPQQVRKPRHPRKNKRQKEGATPHIASTEIGAGAVQHAHVPSVRPPPLVGLEQQTPIDVPVQSELITPSSPTADTVATVRKSSLAKPQQSSSRKPAKTVRFAPLTGAETFPTPGDNSASSAPARTTYAGSDTIFTPASPTDFEGRDFSDDKYIRCLSKIGDRSETPGDAGSSAKSGTGHTRNSSDQDDRTSHEDSRRLYIGNIGPEATEQDLRDLFVGFAMYDLLLLMSIPTVLTCS